MECNLAREKLAMSNVRLVMSIAQRYDNMGAEMSDLVQVISKSCALFYQLFMNLFYKKVFFFCCPAMKGGLIGLLRGIEKFDSSKGFRISTYVYWWIRQVRSIASPHMYGYNAKKKN